MFNVKDYCAAKLTDRQLYWHLTKAERKAKKFLDNKGIIGHNIAADRVAAFKWEIARRRGKF